MAEFKAVGLDELSLSLQEIAEIPEDVQDEMLEAQGAVVARAQRESARRYGIYDPESGKHVADSIKPGRIKLDKRGYRVLYVYPAGSRTRGETKTRNAEIAFVNEYGADKTRHIKARPFMRDANERSAEATTQAAADIYYRWQESRGL